MHILPTTTSGDQPASPRCQTCAEPIEWVPTPPGANPGHHPPYWRHVNAATHPARLAQTDGGQ